MSFTVLEAEPSLNKYLYYFVSYLYFCCSKRFHNSHIAASFQVILKENRLQIYIKQWNCLVKSELFLYKSINFRECKDNQLSLPLKWYSQHLLRPPPPILHPPRHLLFSPIKDFPDSELPTDRQWGGWGLWETADDTEKKAEVLT